MTQTEVHYWFDYRDGGLYWKRDNGSNRTEIGQRAGYANPAGYWRIKVKGVHYMEHKLVFLYFNGYLPECVDHINGMKGDNRIENLREATPSQNGMNRGISKSRSSTGVKNVSYYPRFRKYAVRITVEGVTHFIGHYDTLEEAAEAAEEAREKYHGDFARS